MNYFLPNMISCYKCNKIILNNFQHDYFFKGLEGTIPFSIFSGTINNNLDYQLFTFDELSNFVKDEINNSELEEFLIDFGSVCLESFDYNDCLGKMVLDTIVDNKKVYFEIADIKLANFLIERYPKIKIILHQNAFYFLSADQLKEFLNLNNENIYGGVFPPQISKEIFSLFSKKPIKICIMYFSECFNCKNLKSCIKFDQQKTLEYSTKSKFNECENNMLIQDINFYKEQLALISDLGVTTILFNTVPEKKQYDYYKYLENLFKEGIL